MPRKRKLITYICVDCGNPHKDKRHPRCLSCGYKKIGEAQQDHPTCYWLGKKRSQETINKIKVSRLGKLRGDNNPSKRLEVRKKISEAKKGVTTRSGYKLSDEHKRKIGVAHIGKIVSPDSRLKMSLSRKGKPCPNKGKPLIKIRGVNHWNWRGGRGILRHRIMSTVDYKNWRREVFKRDDYTCQFCHIKGGTIHADHYPLEFAQIIEQNHIRSMEEAIKTPILWDINNGRTLCYDCHKIRHSSVNKITNMNSPMGNILLFDRLWEEAWKVNTPINA